MTSLNDFLTLVRDHLGLSIDADELRSPLDELAGWDSVHLLSLCSAIERETGASISLPAVLKAGTLEDIYAVTAGAA